MKRSISVLLFFCSFVVSGFAYNGDLTPLKSAAQDGIGPLSVPHLRHMVLGSAFVYGKEYPDLFVVGTGKTTELYLFKWLKCTDDGTPVFDEPVVVKSPFKINGSILQTKDSDIHALWLKKDSLIHTVFDKRTCSFNKLNAVKLPLLESKPRSIAASLNQDGSVDLFLEMAGYAVPPKYGKQNPSSEEWRPYDEAGVSTTGLNYTYLCNIRYPELLSGKPQVQKIVTPTNKEVRGGMMNLAVLQLNESDKQEIVCGSRLGNFSYYSRPEKSFEPFACRKYLADSDEIVIQHPTISASVCAYWNPTSGVTDLIACGEGAVYYYKFSGKFTNDGRPVFNTPTKVLQVNADLFCGTLPVPSVADLNGDGAEDIIVGNSDGHVLFFENVGDNSDPRFLPSVNLKSCGRDIHIQAGYSGSVQGTMESRWGYLSPTVVDWTDDGLFDIIMGDITGNYVLYVNIGTAREPMFDLPQPLYCEGLELHGMWRSRAAVAKMGDRMALAIVDDNDLFHLYWKIDNYHLEDGGLLRLDNGKTILTSAEPAGGTGRCKLNFFDYDGDGLLDLIIGTGRRAAIPDLQTGFPLPILGKKTMGTPLFMKNVGTESQPKFLHPYPFKHAKAGLVQPGGSHESGAVGTRLGMDNNLLVGNEVGRLYLLRRENLELMSIEDAMKYRNTPNPFPGFPYPLP